MTKFEEEFKRPANGPLTELNNNMQEVFSQYRKMRQYADYLEYNSKKKDEEFQELFDKYSNLNDNYEKEVIKSSKLESQIIDLKSQLQQQALPVVPEFVGEAVIGIDLDYLFSGYSNGINEKAKEWLEKHRGVKSLGYYICQLRFQGFEVEKPQLFYLKHIDMSKSDAHLNWYLAKGTDNVLIHQGIKKGKSPELKCVLKLTKEEIASMQTGSYEQIEVEK